MGSFFVSSTLLLLLISTSAVSISRVTEARALDGVLFEGRWKRSSTYASADWPCASARFLVRKKSTPLKNNLEKISSIDIEWNGLRSRLEVSMYEGPPLNNRRENLIMTKIFKGESVDVFDLRRPRKIKIDISNITLGSEIYTVVARKLTTSSPFGTGIGESLLRASTVHLHSVNVTSSTLQVIRNNPSQYVSKGRRRIEFIGASDTAGYCVDGNPNQSPLVYGPEGWEYENCNAANVANLGRAFNADISVTAISGIGLTQNANTKEQWEMGKRTMSDYWNYTMQSDDKHPWNFSSWTPQLVYISLGGNDFNHQNGNVPTNKSFAEAYVTFVERVMGTYGPDVRVLGVCGQGSPVEAKEDPDNNRCRPCPFVSDATDAFRAKHPDLSDRIDYTFVPCDGSVVTGSEDIGCAGHKNTKGQGEVSAFLIPKVRAFMGWGVSSMSLG